MALEREGASDITVWKNRSPSGILLLSIINGILRVKCVFEVVGKESKWRQF